MSWWTKLKYKLKWSRPSKGEIASKKVGLNFISSLDWLPDPDPILKKMGIDYDIYRELESESHVFSCITSRSAGVLNREILLTPAGNSRKEKYAYEFVKDIEDNLWNMSQIISETLDAPLYGFVPHELIWQKEDNHWYIENIIGKPQEWFKFGVNNELLFMERNSLKGEAVPMNKFLVTQYKPTYLNPYGKKILSRCFWPVMFKKNGVKFWMVYAEKYGIPYKVIKYQRGTKEEEIEKMMERAKKMVQDAIIAVPEDGSVELITAGDKKSSSDFYSKLKESMDKELSKVILGHSSAVDATPGKLGNEKGIITVRKDIVDEDKRLVAGTIQKAINLMIMFETGDISLAPKFSFYEEEDIQKDRAERDDLLGKQIDFKKKYYIKNYNFKDDEFDIKDTELPSPADDSNIQTFTAGSGRQKKQTKKLEDLSEKFISKIKFNPYSDITDILKDCESYEEFNKKLEKFLDRTKNIKKLEDKLAAANLTAEAMGRNSGE